MKVTIELPEDVSAALKRRWDDVPRRSLEAITIEAYRTGALTESQVRRLLRFETRFEVHALLKERGVPLRYTEADLKDDIRTHVELGVLDHNGCLDEQEREALHDALRDSEGDVKAGRVVNAGTVLRDLQSSKQRPDH